MGTAGIGNKIVFGEGFKLQPSSSQSIGEMQKLSTDISYINHTGNPENNIAANPGSTSHDPVSGNIYMKASGTGNTGWLQISPVISYTLTGNSGGALSPTANNWNILGGVNSVITGSVSTLTVRSDILTYLQPGAYPYNILDTDYFISVDTSLSRTIRLPNAPTTGKSYIIKDRVGSAGVNNITVTTVGGAVTIDGSTTFAIHTNYGSIGVVFNGTSYEVF